MEFDFFSMLVLGTQVSCHPAGPGDLTRRDGSKTYTGSDIIDPEIDFLQIYFLYLVKFLETGEIRI